MWYYYSGLDGVIGSRFLYNAAFVLFRLQRNYLLSACITAIYANSFHMSCPLIFGWSCLFSWQTMCIYFCGPEHYRRCVLWLNFTVHDSLYCLFMYVWYLGFLIEMSTVWLCVEFMSVICKVIIKASGWFPFPVVCYQQLNVTKILIVNTNGKSLPAAAHWLRHSKSKIIRIEVLYYWNIVYYSLFLMDSTVSKFVLYNKAICSIISYRKQNV